MDIFGATDQYRKCLKRNLSKISAQIKIINSANEAETICEQLNIDNVGFKLYDKCRRLIFLAHENLQH